MAAPSIDHLRDTLSTWLAATDIALLELRGPAGVLCLLNHCGHVVPLPAVPSDVPRLAVTALCAGRFLRAHPLHDTPLAQVGERVRAGQPIGLLQVGALLRAVTAPAAGILTAFPAEDQCIAGYGTTLAELQPLA